MENNAHFSLGYTSASEHVRLLIVDKKAVAAASSVVASSTLSSMVQGDIVIYVPVILSVLLDHLGAVDIVSPILHWIS